MASVIFKGIFSSVLMLSSAIVLSEPNPLHQQLLNADLVVWNQHGQQQHFYNELIKNQRVAINFIFTSCRSSCPLSTAIFKQVQKKLGKQNVHLITISIDPAVDTPERLLAFSQKFQAGPGWSFITAEKTALDGLLKTLEVFSADKALHTNQIIVGNDLIGRWTRLYGMPNAKTIVTALQQVAVAKSD